MHYNNVSCILDVCLLFWVLIGLHWVLPMMPLISHVTCSCIFHAYILFFILNMLLHSILSLSLSLSLSNRLRHDTQTAQIYSDLDFLWFRVIFFFYSSRTLSYLVPWWEGQVGLLRELPGPWRSSGTPGNSVEFHRHSSLQSHLDSRLGISTWETHEMSHRVYSGVLLQHARHRYCCASICYYIQRYTYRSYSKSYIRGTTHP